ncbi:MAG: DUF721 domain-containing protein [Saprospiraceae bacterium]|jgi:predicted nucleic acid-binding Zn ribbon protein
MRHNDKNIKEVLNDYLASNDKVAKGYYTSHIDVVWKEEMGPIIASYTKKIYFKNGLLKIYLTSAPLKKELLMNKSKIIDNINAALGTNLVAEVEIY